MDQFQWNFIEIFISKERCALSYFGAIREYSSPLAIALVYSQQIRNSEDS